MRESERDLERETQGGNGPTRDKSRGGWPWQQRKVQYKDLDNNTTSIFFTNFPDDCLGTDLWKVFLRFSKVREVFIPQKLDRWGNRFGFIKFLEVADEVALGFRLEEVWIGDCRLKINKARFGREYNVTLPVRNRKEVVKVKADGGPRVLTYKDEIMNVRVQQPVVPSRMLKLVLSEECLKRLEKCFVAVLAFKREAKEVSNSLAMGGFKQINVISMGDNQVILKSQNSSAIVEAESKQEEWWRGLFKEVKCWSPNVVVKNRKV